MAFSAKQGTCSKTLMSSLKLGMASIISRRICIMRPLRPNMGIMRPNMSHTTAARKRFGLSILLRDEEFISLILTSPYNCADLK
eukprot:16700_6